MRSPFFRMFRRLLAAMFGPAFGSDKLSLGVLLKHVLLQKLLRINGHVPWPVHPTSQVKAVERIARGDRFPGLSAGCHIDGRNGIEIGANVWIGPRVTLVSMNHDPCDYARYLEAPPIVIGADSWLGANAVVLPGVVLGRHTVVAAGAVVTGSFPDGDQLLAGCPAKVVKRLPPYRHGETHA